jgi:hypothetical protein
MIDLAKLDFEFTSKPLLVGGEAMGMKEPKYHRDLELIVDKALQVRYEEYQKENQERR